MIPPCVPSPPPAVLTRRRNPKWHDSFSGRMVVDPEVIRRGHMCFIAVGQLRVVCSVVQYCQCPAFLVINRPGGELKAAHFSLCFLARMSAGEWFGQMNHVYDRSDHCTGFGMTVLSPKDGHPAGA